VVNFISLTRSRCVWRCRFCCVKVGNFFLWACTLLNSVAL